MTIQAVVYAVLFFIGTFCIIRANLLFFDVVADVNRLSPEDRAIPLAGFMRHRFGEAVTRYRRHYPDGKLILKMYVWAAIGFLSFFGIAGFWLVSMLESRAISQPA